MATARTVGSLARWRRVPASALLLALVGCGTTAVFVPPRGPSADAGLVHFIRQSYPPYVFSCQIVLNGRALASIANNDFVAVDVPSGRNRVTISCSQGEDLPFDLEVQPNETHYIVFWGEVHYAGATGLGHAYNIERGARAVTSAEGRRVMRQLRHPVESTPVQSTVGAIRQADDADKAKAAKDAKAAQDAADAEDAERAAHDHPGIHVRLLPVASASAPSLAPPGGRRPVWTLGLDFGMAGGGDELIRTTLTDGSMESLSAGTGVSIYLHLSKAFAPSPRHTLFAGVAGGIKGWNIGDNSNYGVQLLRFPIIPFVRYVHGERPGFQPFLAAGLHTELGTNLSGSGAASEVQYDFDNAFGWMAEVGLVASGPGSGDATLGLRYTHLTYDGPALLSPVDASSFGAFLGLQWTSLAGLP